MIKLPKRITQNFVITCADIEELSVRFYSAVTIVNVQTFFEFVPALQGFTLTPLAITCTNYCFTKAAVSCACVPGIHPPRV